MSLLRQVPDGTHAWVGGANGVVGVAGVVRHGEPDAILVDMVTIKLERPELVSVGEELEVRATYRLEVED